MAEEEEDSKVHAPISNSPSKQSQPFVEVICKSSGKRRRFAAGTEAGFASSLINRKLGDDGPPALYIEAVKEEEESVSFGPNSVLVNYGDGWELQTVNEAQGTRKRDFGYQTRVPSPMGPDDSRRMKKAVPVSPPLDNYWYIGKILLAFILIFVMGAVLTLALENLPRLILLINSSI
ncbi:uncharacterized protein LOC127790068 [Diospyros lotus]|uniref:uncharacterized protein LOC127790068 n=1 Tax=Diospyros lotus TaxID=55363 RepID=UPI00224ED397|nr:uncharacterized protein LOC127790068 [Diospyros lotus]